MLRASPAVNLPLTRPLGWAVGDFFGQSLSGRACGRRAPNRDFRDRSFNSQTTSMSIKLSRKSASRRSRPRAWSQVATSMTSSEGCATNHARHGVHRSSKVAPRKAQKKFGSPALLHTLLVDLASSLSSCGMTFICANETAGVDGFRSLMGQGRKLFGCRRFRVPAFSTCSFGA
jgi:hypothetical protein